MTVSGPIYDLTISIEIIAVIFLKIIGLPFFSITLPWWLSGIIFEIKLFWSEWPLILDYLLGRIIKILFIKCKIN